MSKKPPYLDRLSPALAEAARDVRKIWRLVKDLAGMIGKTIEMAGNTAIAGAYLTQEVAKLVKRYGARFLIPAFLGCISPLTRGLGIDFLQRSSLTEWAPVGILPTAVAIYLIIRWTFDYLDREGERQTSRNKRERRQPGVLERLAQSRTYRLIANWDIRFAKGLPGLEEESFCADELGAALARMQARGHDDLAVVLLSNAKKKDKGKKRDGLQPTVTKGEVDSAVAENLHLGKIEPSKLEQELTRLLDPLRYRHAQVEFDAGPRRYVLLVVSGATISDDVLCEIDDTATGLVELYVEAARRIQEEVEEA